MLIASYLQSAWIAHGFDSINWESRIDLFDTTLEPSLTPTIVMRSCGRCAKHRILAHTVNTGGAVEEVRSTLIKCLSDAPRRTKKENQKKRKICYIRTQSN